MRRGLVAVALFALVAGCGGVETGPTAYAPMNTVPGTDPAVLTPWEGFPVGRRPRPIVLVGGAVSMIGFHSGDAKLAALTGRFELAVPLPQAPATVQAHLADGTATLPARSAQEAYDLIRGSGKPENAPDATPSPIRFTSVRLGAHSFATDRGPMRLPAWLFDGPDLIEPMAVPALASSAFWSFGEVTGSHEVGPATLAADGVTLTVEMPAAAPACPGQPVHQYTAIVVESAQAVGVGLRDEITATAPGTPGENCGLRAMLRMESYVVKLTAPLGDRVVVDHSSSPVAVTVR